MFKGLFFRFRWMLLLASLLSAISALAGLGMLSIITDSIAGLENGSLNASYSFLTFILSVLVVLGAGLLSQYILLRVGAIVVFEVQNTLLQRILTTAYIQIEMIGGAKILAVMKDDVARVAQGFMLIPMLIYNLVTVLLCLGYMIYLSWRLSLFVVVVVSMIVIVAKVIIKFATIHQVALRECMDLFFSGLNALSNGGKELNLDRNRRAYFYKSVMIPVFEKIKSRTVKSEILFVSVETFAGILIFFLIGVIVYGAHYFQSAVTVEVVIAFVLVVLYFIDPLKSVVGVLGEANEVFVSLRKIESLELSNKDVLIESSGVVSKGAGKKINCLKIVELCFQYDSPDCQEGYLFSLGPISTEFRAGEVTFITGGNGSGKSTFAKLIVGLFSQESGSIYVDGKLVDKYENMDEYKANFSVLFSDFYLFDQFLDSEGKPADDRVITEHLKYLSLDDKVGSENGVLSCTNLSDGQRKRLALIQSFLSDTPVCVYDEWAADQDPKFKQYFYTNILPNLKMKGKIVIIITHDDRFFELADKLIKLEDGRMVN